MAVGSQMKFYGLNTVGLQRAGFPEATIRELKHAYRLLFRSELNLSQAIERVREEVEQIPEVEHLLAFIEASPRGVAF